MAVTQNKTPQSPRLTMLQLARKAGKLTVGMDATLRSMSRREVYLLVMAADFSSGSKSRARDMADQYKLEIVEWGTKEVLGTLLNRSDVGLLGITDKNLALGFIKARD